MSQSEFTRLTQSPLAAREYFGALLLRASADGADLTELSAASTLPLDRLALARNAWLEALATTGDLDAARGALLAHAAMLAELLGDEADLDALLALHGALHAELTAFLALPEQAEPWVLRVPMEKYPIRPSEFFALRHFEYRIDGEFLVREVPGVVARYFALTRPEKTFAAPLAFAR